MFPLRDLGDPFLFLSLSLFNVKTFPRDIVKKLDETRSWILEVIKLDEDEQKLTQPRIRFI